MAFVLGIIQAAGCTTTVPVIDGDKVDFTLERQNSGPNPHLVTSPNIQVQMKATSTYVESDGHFIYDFEAEAHRRLADPLRHLPAILIVLHVPVDSDDWVSTTDQETAMRHQAFWYELSGQVPTTNKKKVRLKIPLTNQVNTGSINDLLDRVKLGERSLV